MSIANYIATGACTLRQSSLGHTFLNVSPLSYYGKLAVASGQFKLQHFVTSRAKNRTSFTTHVIPV